MIPKNFRQVDKNLLNTIRDQSCVACGRTPVDPCHIKSRGAGGHDDPENVLPMCRMHHVEQHQIGWHRMSHKYVSITWALAMRNWKFDGRGKLVKITNPSL